jgi:hypothetical protein
MTTTTKSEKAGKNLGGRPPKEINLDLVQDLARIHCTDAEIANICKVSQETFTRRKRDPAFAELLEQARDEGKASLRRLQWQAAQNGNSALLIFLGKNILRQRDKTVEEERDVAADKARELSEALRAMADTEGRK